MAVLSDASPGRMSDICQGCQFDPKTTCPLTPLYWAFSELAIFDQVSAVLSRGQELKAP